MGKANTNPMTCSIDSKTIAPNTRLYPHQIEEWECLFSARSGGTNVHTLWETDGERYVHTKHDTDTRVRVNDNYVCSYEIIQVGNFIKTTLLPEEVDDKTNGEAGFLKGQYNFYNATWRGRTISVSTNLDYYKKNFTECEFEQIRDTGLHDVTFDIQLISGGRV
ncbi:hypothetical protein [Natrinema versiforme]|uniref:Uncharacterized protein n=1 Tax=Natrinema versiforme TaxID=88724 RepID=A0A4P8WKR4_9EURY|nr:hypothetical protein [Natrinema versiforme]QCS43885.1 hypothetical protein FEJ81_16595 [Natrinema versiforme]